MCPLGEGVQRRARQTSFRSLAAAAAAAAAAGAGRKEKRIGRRMMTGDAIKNTFKCVA